MGLRIRKSFKICKGLRINVSKSGMSVSGGVRGARVSVNTKGVVRRSVGIPGTGVYYSDQHKITSKSTNTKATTHRTAVIASSGRTSNPTSMSSADKITMTIFIVFFICFIVLCFEIIKAIL